MWEEAAVCEMKKIAGKGGSEGYNINPKIEEYRKTRAQWKNQAAAHKVNKWL